MNDEPTADDDAQDIEARVSEIVEIIEAADPDNIAALGAVVVLKDEQDLTADGEPSDGVACRILNADLDGYETTGDVLSAAGNFDNHLDEIKLEPGKRKGGLLDGLKGLFG